MNYHNILHDDMRNGKGLRVVLFVSGCTHKCTGCHNPQTWDTNGGIEFDDYAITEIAEQLDKPYIDGITFSGGDPLHPMNRTIIGYLCMYFKQNYPNKTIWLYTGYLWEDIKDLSFVPLVDVIVDGPFIQEKANVQYLWAGSTNQRVIDVKETLHEGSVIRYEYN